MTRTSFGKSKFFIVMISLLIVGIMLVGVTFAMETLSVRLIGEETKVEDNKDFGVDLQVYDGEDYVTTIGDSARPAFDQNALWCPGRTEIVYLRLVNSEVFPVRCALSLNVTKNGFGDALTYAVIHENLLPKTDAHPQNWTEFVNQADVTAKANLSTEQEKHEILTVDLGGGENCYVAFAIHMDESASSAYKGRQMEMNFVVKTDADYKPGTTLEEIAAAQ